MLKSNFKYALRSFIKNPGFALTALITLALGIGANTAVFSLIYGVLLHNLPYPDANRLVVVAETLGEGKTRPVSYPNYLDWKSEDQVFENLAAYSSENLNLRFKDRTERIPGEFVSDSYFPVLGISPHSGRTFTKPENDELGSHPVVVLSYGCWQRRFGSDSNLIGKNLKLNGTDFTVIGIMPKEFRGFSGETDLWLPMGMWDVANPEIAQFDFLHARDIHWHQVLGRLKPGITLNQVRTRMQTIAVHLEKAYPGANANRGIRIEQAQESLVGEIRSPLYILLGAVAFILLIACANVANLMLFRAAERKREIAIRQALGASRAQLVAQLITESTLLTVTGGCVGLLFAFWGIDLLSLFLPSDVLLFSAIRINVAVLAFTMILALVTGILLGLAPAMQTYSKHLSLSLEEGSARAGRRSGARNALVVAEISLALVLMIGAGLLLKSFQQLRSTHLGFQPDHLLTMRFDVPAGKYSGADRANAAHRLLKQVQQIPGVVSAGMNTADLFLLDGIQRGFTVPERPSLTASERDTVFFQDISPGFFKTMQIPLLAGRDFTPDDNANAQPVAIVSDAFARFIWPDQDPVGRKFKYGPADSHFAWITVVGVVGNMKFVNLRHDPFQDPAVYVPLAQSEVVTSMSLLVRSANDPASMIPSLRSAIQKFDADIPVYSVATMEERMVGEMAETRSYTLLLGSFAILAMLLSMVGIYGVTSHSVSRRTQEIGVRMALGAQKSDVFRMVAGEGILLATYGISIGLLASWLMTRMMTAMLYGVSATDGITFGWISALLVAVSVVASYIPARKATEVDPMTALRYE